MPEWSIGYRYFLQFQSEFGNKEFMIWATVSSQSCFCCLSRASPSLVAKNIINLISMLTMGVMSMCRVFSCVVGRGYFLWPVHFLPSVLQGQICLLLQVFLEFLLLHSSPLQWRGHLFWVLVLESLIGLHRTVQLQLLQHYWLGHRLGVLWYLIVCLGN